jgi:GNAT superfamily N-acetyltransferase
LQPAPVRAILSRRGEAAALESVPMSYSIRDATLLDAEPLAALHVQTFRETHGGGPSMSVRRAQWEQILGKSDPTDFTLLVYESAGALVGFARGTPHDGSVPGYQGRLNKLYVLRRCHRQGLGRLLVCRVAHRFLDQGVTSMLLFGDARSPANGFYERLGAERLLSAEGEFHGGYGWRDLAVLAQHCDDVTRRSIS